MIYPSRLKIPVKTVMGIAERNGKQIPVAVYRQIRSGFDYAVRENSSATGIFRTAGIQ